MNEVIITTSWDDAHPLNLKVGKLLKKYGIPATFFISIKNIGIGREFRYLKERKSMTFNQIKKIAKDFDVGGHTLSHTDLTRVSKERAEEEVLEGKKILEDIIGKEVVSFCYPWGSYNKSTIELVKKCGFKGAKTIDIFRREIKNPFEIGTMVHAAQHRRRSYVFNLTKKFINLNDLKLLFFISKNHLFDKSWDQIAIKTLEFVIKNGGIWHLWGHSWEIEMNNDWKKLEDVFKKVKKMTDKKNVKFMDNSQLILNFLNLKNRD